MRVLSVIGTRPEAIKMAPILTKLKKDKEFKSYLCLTTQHKEMLCQVLDLFKIRPDFDLDIMKHNQNLFDITTNVLKGLKKVFKDVNPDVLLVQGDTSTTFAAALAAFYLNIKIGHIEAGLRTYDKYAPYPEEINRQFVSRIADLHFAPTERAKQNLLNEKVKPETVFVTGNTAVDCLFFVLKKLKRQSLDQVVKKLTDNNRKVILNLFYYLQKSRRRLILVTGHRRENFGVKLKNICFALRELALRDDVEIVYPVHLNPNVQKPVRAILSGYKNIHLIEPLDYLSFVFLMDKSFLIITDSGGIQEEAPSLGKPVLVTREVTERPEAMEAGTVKIVGANKNKIVELANQLLDNVYEYQKMAFVHNPYGDGKASLRIIKILKSVDKTKRQESAKDIS